MPDPENVSLVSENNTMIHRRKNKGRTMACNRPAVGRIAGVVMAVTAVFLAGGCASPSGDADVTVVKIKSGTVKEAGLWYVDGSAEDIFTFSRVHGKRAKESAEKTLEVTVPLGSLLRVVVGGPDDKSGLLRFPYRFDGAEKQPLVFSRSGFQGMVNGKLVHLDLASPEAVAWLEKQPASVTKAVRSIHLGGTSPDDARALSHFKNSGVIVWFDFAKGSKPVKSPAVVQALIAAKPSGLFAPGGENLDELLAKLPDLKYLCSSGKRIPNLAPLRKLKFLGFKFKEDSPGSMTPLAGATGLQSLFLECKAATDLKSIAALSDLRRLDLGAPKMKDLSILSGMKKLRRLMVSCEGMKDISDVRGMRSLRQAALVSIPSTVEDLTPLESLTGLRILIVDKKILEQRKAEFDKIQKALPDTEIIGFCMGSAWIFIPILAAGFALLRHKRKAVASHRP